MSFEALLKYPVIFFSALAVSLALTPVWIRLAVALGFVDQPGDRKIHTSAVPVGGGVVVFLGFHTACILLFGLPWKPFAAEVSVDWWFRFAPLSLGILLLGLADDRYALSPQLKLIGQTLFAVAAYAVGIRLQNILGVSLPMWFDFAATVFWFLLVVNAFNLIDGIDGLAAGIAVIASLGIGLSMLFRKSPGDVLLFAGLAGACLGFLRYNFYPAKVFLGDTGSMFVGFTLAALSISTQSKGPAIAAIGMPMLAIGVPLFDTLLAVWRRTVRNELSLPEERKAFLGVDRGDDEHLHHRLLKRGQDHSQVAVTLYAATVLLAGLGIVTSIFHDRALGILGIAFLVGSYIVVQHLAGTELRESGRVVLRGLVQPVRRNRTLLAYVLADVMILNGVFLIAFFLLEPSEGWSVVALKSAWLKYAPLEIGIPFLMLALFRSYSRVWYLARVSEYMFTGIAVILGCGLATALRPLFGYTGLSRLDLIVHFIVMTGISAPCIVGIRAFVRVVQDLMYRFAGRGGVSSGWGRRSLICGAGYRTTLFLRQLSMNQDPDESLNIVGLVDSDHAVRGHWVHGVLVLGTYAEIVGLVERHRVDRIYLVEPMSEEEEKTLIHALNDYPVRIIRWTISESDVLPVS